MYPIPLLNLVWNSARPPLHGLPPSQTLAEYTSQSTKEVTLDHALITTIHVKAADVHALLLRAGTGALL